MADRRRRRQRSDPVTFATQPSSPSSSPAGNAAGVRSLADLADADVQTAICAADVPCGAATAELLQRNETSVNAGDPRPRREVRSWSGSSPDEVDAGIVYVTDASAPQATP